MRHSFILIARIVSVVIVLFGGKTQAAESSLNAKNDHGLAREEAAVSRFHLSRFKNQAQLKRAINQKLIVRVPDSGVGFGLDPRVGIHAAEHQEYYRYARPYTLRFITRIGEEYAKRTGGGAITISSLVRDCRYQRLIAKGDRAELRNYNAAPSEATSHTTGATIDILVGSVDGTARGWFRKVLLTLESRGFILATEEHAQPVFHVMVLPTYAHYAPKPAKHKTLKRKPKSSRK